MSTSTRGGHFEYQHAHTRAMDTPSAMLICSYQALELLHTERSYLRDLHTLRDLYFEPMQHLHNIPKVRSIFGTADGMSGARVRTDSLSALSRHRRRHAHTRAMGMSSAMPI